MLRIRTGDEDVQTNREIGLRRHFRQPARGHPARHRFACCAGRSRQMSLRTERCAAGGRSLVLSRRPRHQTCLLVCRRREGKACAGRAGNVAAGGRPPSLRRTALTRSYRSPTRAPNSPHRRCGPSRRPSPGSGRHPRPSPVRSTRRMTGARTQAIPAPTDRWSPHAGSSRRAWLRRRRLRHRRTNSANQATGRFGARAADSPVPARRGRRIFGQAVRLGPAAADRHCRRAGACGLAGKRDLPAQRRTADWPSRHRRGWPRQLGFGQNQSPNATG